MNIVITGGNGFIGKNLKISLLERGFSSIKLVTRATTPEEFKSAVDDADLIYHLAGEMRASQDIDFIEGNVHLTKELCAYVADSARPIKIIFTSSISAESTPDTTYSKTKYQAETDLRELSENFGVPVVIYRLPHVFGKWARPFYNSLIATACHSVSRGLAVVINNPASVIYPLHIDNLVDQLCGEIDSHNKILCTYAQIENVHTISIGEMFDIVKSFADVHTDMKIEEVGVGLIRELYATYVSYLPEEKFSYPLISHSDDRGTFVEFLKTKSSGQVSYFTANPGVSRGNHYHHSKTEKFLVVYGRARFAFKSLVNGKQVSIDTSSDVPTVVDSIPGWVHNITNIGDSVLIVMLWANEVFDKSKPDTIYSLISNSSYEKA